MRINAFEKKKSQESFDWITDSEDACYRHAMVERKSLLTFTNGLMSDGQVQSDLFSVSHFFSFAFDSDVYCKSAASGRWAFLYTRLSDRT